VMNELHDFLAWGSKQNQSGGEPFPYSTIAYWIGRYEMRQKNPQKDQARRYWQGSTGVAGGPHHNPKD